MSCIIVFIKNSISDFLGFLSQLFEEVKELHKLQFSILININIGSFTISVTYKQREHRMAEQHQGSADCGKLDLKSEVNHPASGKLRKSTTVSSQCEKIY